VPPFRQGLDEQGVGATKITHIVRHAMKDAQKPWKKILLQDAVKIND